MLEMNRDWIGKQLGKIVAAYGGVLKTEQDHREHVDVSALKELYADIVSRDEMDLNDVKRVAADNEDHTRMMLDACVTVGLVEARKGHAQAA